MKNKILLIFFIIVIILFPIAASDNPEQPSEFTINVSDYIPKRGDTVTITLMEIPYIVGSFNGFYIDIYYGTKEEKEETLPELVDYILEDGFFRPSNINDENANQYWMTYSFIPYQSGIVTVEAYAHRQYDVTHKIVKIDVLEKIISNNSTPSFEITFVISSIFIVLFLKKHIG